MYNSSPRSCMTGSTMRGWRASFAKGVLYMCAAKFVRTEPRHFFDKHLDLIRSEQARKEKIAVAFEMLDFLRAELHREISLLDSGRAMSGVTSAPSRGGKAARAQRVGLYRIIDPKMPGFSGLRPSVPARRPAP